MSEYVGFDVSKEATAFCVKDVTGKILARGKVATDPGALFEALRNHCACPERIVLETGTLSGWLSRALGTLGIAVDAIDARQAHAVMKLQHNKRTTRRFWRMRPVAVKSEAAQADRIRIKARAHLVRQRRDTQNTIRGLLASLGIRFAKGSGKLAGRVREALADRPALRLMIEPLLCAALAREIARLDKAVSARAKDNPAVRLLMSVPGAGDGAGLCGDDRRRRAVRHVARGGRRSRVDVAALAIGRDGRFGAPLQTRRFAAARAALRGRQQPVDGGAQGPSVEGLGPAG